MSPRQKNAISFTKRLLLFLVVGTASIFLIKAIYALGPEQSLESSNQERKLKAREFKDMPVEVVEIRNGESEDWWKDLEIEVKNVSSKPIYFVRAYLLLPDEKLSWGESGIRLTWGDSAKLDARNYATADAERVEPGKTFVLTIPEMFREGLAKKQRLHPEVTKNLEIEFTKIYFGDGTGFEAQGWRDFRGNDPPPKQDKKHHSSRPNGKKWNHSTASIPEPICGGGNCFRWVIPTDPVPTSCNGCLTIVATSSPSAPCTYLGQKRFNCNVNGVISECFDDVIDNDGGLAQGCEGAVTVME